MEGCRKRMEGGQFEDCCGRMKGNKQDRRIGGSRDFECAHDSGYRVTFIGS